MLPNRLNEFEETRAQGTEGDSWIEIYRWSEAVTEQEVLRKGAGRPEKSRDLIQLPKSISDSISGKRVKVSIDMESGSSKFIQLFGVDLSSAERGCLCIRRVALGTSRKASEVIFDLPEKTLIKDKLRILSAADSSLKDLTVYSISISVGASTDK